jgi:hypothetical protein
MADPPMSEDHSLIWTLDRQIESMRAALARLSRPIPSTKGMAPKDRAQRLHSDLERRIAIARDALFPRLEIKKAEKGQVSDG